tara:strand:+ start:239 stop:628 length:390 start_codon:yes stop_codon:yes gene_type:complete
MKTNSIPENIESRLPDGVDVYSFDVSEDGKLAAILVCGEDTDFPEPWIYNSETDELKCVDNDVLMNFPVSKAFFAEGAVDMVAVPFSWTPVEPMLIQISPDNYECVGCAPYDPNSEYFKKKNGVVKGME